MYRAAAAADFLDLAHRQRAPYKNLPPELAPTDLAEAYAIQRAFHDLLIPRLGAIGGWKIAVTTPAMRKILQIPRPVVGAIFTRCIHQAPAILCTADFIHPGLEFEIALELGCDLPQSGVPYTLPDVETAVAAAYPAFELIEDRFADYQTTQGTSLCADNAWNAGIVLGPRITCPDPGFLQTAVGTVVFEGCDLGPGTSTPLESLAWLANELNNNGFALQKGMIIMTGSLVATQYPKAGSTARFSAKGLGELAVEFT